MAVSPFQEKEALKLAAEWNKIARRKLIPSFEVETKLMALIAYFDKKDEVKR